MSELKVKGAIKVLEETKSYGSNGFEKREFVIETDEQYPQQIKLEFTQQKCELLNGYSVGDKVEVSFNLNGNEYNGKYYVNLQAWKINGKKSNPNAVMESARPKDEVPTHEPLSETEEEDDLPF